jgi:hypothetical protein
MHLIELLKTLGSPFDQAVKINIKITSTKRCTILAK